jgi:hypothetical protein
VYLASVKLATTGKFALQLGWSIQWNESQDQEYDKEVLLKCCRHRRWGSAEINVGSTVNHLQD